MTCPICHRETLREFRPFCSKRCADVDLGRWLTETYRVATEEEPGESAKNDRPYPPNRP